MNTVSESEWNRYLPAGVSVHASRMRALGEIGAENEVDELAEMNTHVREGAELLATANVDVVVYGVTAGSYLGGQGYDVELEADIADATGLPGIATAASMRRAFDALDVDAVAIATPYVEPLDDLEVELLEAHGYEVIAIDGRGIAEVAELGTPTPESVYRQAAAVDRPEADAVFISGMNYRTAQIIETLERDLGKPVLSSNSVTMWDALRTVGVETSEVTALGSLLAE